jgi:hypothetical protein
VGSILGVYSVGLIFVSARHHAASAGVSTAV